MDLSLLMVPQASVASNGFCMLGTGWCGCGITDSDLGSNISFFFLFLIDISILIDFREGGGERERNIDASTWIGCLLLHPFPCWGSSPPPQRAPRLGIEGRPVGAGMTDTHPGDTPAGPSIRFAVDSLTPR